MKDEFEKYMSLSELPPGQEGEITEIYGGRGLRDKLGGRGLLPGKSVKKEFEYGMGGPVYLYTEDTHSSYAIGRGIAEKIEVGYNESE